ncbi:MAG: VOC family protein [Solirubrobacteraceae bacterium]
MPDPIAGPGTSPVHGPVHHYGYVVRSLEETIEALVAKFGAGPFFVLRGTPLENVTSRGEPATFDHSAAFGQCGATLVELLEIHECHPPRVRDGFAQGRPQLQHMAFAVPDLDAASARAEDEGLPAFLRADLGDIRYVFHDAADVLGYHVELHADSPGLRGFSEMVRAASDGWDGTEPMRTPSL